MTYIIRRMRGGITAILIVLAGAAAFLALFALPAFAAPFDVSISPAVFDAEGLAGDIIEREVIVSNQSSTRQHFYARVRNITADGGVEESIEPHAPETDRTTSLANWIAVSRGQIVLDPGEDVTIPVVIHINPRAKSGRYHALITFAPSARMSIKEEKAAKAAEVLVSLLVGDGIKESLSLLSFRGDFALTAKDPVTLTYKLENGGNGPVSPEGEIILYDRRGEEVGTVPLNAEGVTIPPGESVALASVWAGAGRAGRFKAFLALDYGSVQAKSLQDTAFFWVVPLPTLATLFVLLLITSMWWVRFMHGRALQRHRVRIEDWHKDAAEKHGTTRVQRVKGIPAAESSLQTPNPAQDPPPALDPKPSSANPVSVEREGHRIVIRGNVVDLRDEEEPT